MSRGDPDVTFEGVLRAASLFRGLSPDSLGLVARTCRRVRFPKGRLIFRQGEEAPGVYCVQSGLVRVYKLAPSGKQHVLHFADPGSTFAEVAALSGAPLPAYAEAAEDTVCALVPAGPFRGLLESNHQLCLELLDGYSQWVRRLVGLLEDLVLRDAAGRVASHLLAAASGSEREFRLKVRKRDLANHLNLTSETLSRTLRRLAESGLVEVGPGQALRVVDRAGLADVAAGMPVAEFER